MAEEPKRKVGRPRKAKAVAPAEVSADVAGMSVAAVSVSLSPDKAWLELTRRAEESAAEEVAAKESVASIHGNLEEATANISTVESQIEELSAVLRSLTAQHADLTVRAADALTAADGASSQRAAVDAARDKVGTFILSLADHQPGLVGGVRITVLDGNTTIEPA